MSSSSSHSGNDGEGLSRSKKKRRKMCIESDDECFEDDNDVIFVQSTEELQKQVDQQAQELRDKSERLKASDVLLKVAQEDVVARVIENKRLSDENTATKANLKLCLETLKTTEILVHSQEEVIKWQNTTTGVPKVLAFEPDADYADLQLKFESLTKEAQDLRTEKTEATQKIRLLEEADAQKQSLATDLQTKVDLFSKKLAETEVFLKDRDAEVADLKSRVSSLEDDCSKLHAKTLSLNMQISQLKTDLDGKDVLMQEKNKLLADTEKRIRETTQHSINIQQEQITDLNVKLKLRADIIAERESQLCTSQNEVKSLTSKLQNHATSSSDNTRLASQLQDKIIELNAMSDKVRSLEIKLKSTTFEKDEIKKQLAEKSSESGSVAQEFQIVSLEAENKRLNALLATNTQKMQDCEKATRILKMNYGAMKDELKFRDDRIKDLEVNLKDATNILSRHKSEKVRLETVNRSLETEVSSLRHSSAAKTNVSELAKIHTATNQKISALETDIEKLQQKIRDQGDRLLNKERELGSKTILCNGKDNQIKKLKSDMRLKDESLAKLKDAQKIASRVKSLEQEIQGLKDEKVALEERYKKLKQYSISMDSKLKSFSINVKPVPHVTQPIQSRPSTSSAPRPSSSRVAHSLTAEQKLNQLARKLKLTIEAVSFRESINNDATNKVIASCRVGHLIAEGSGATSDIARHNSIRLMVPKLEMEIQRRNSSVNAEADLRAALRDVHVQVSGLYSQHTFYAKYIKGEIADQSLQIAIATMTINMNKIEAELDKNAFQTPFSFRTKIFDCLHEFKRSCLAKRELPDAKSGLNFAHSAIDIVNAKLGPAKNRNNSVS